LVRDSIASLRSEKRTIVICTHNLSEAESLADQVAIIYRGRILVNGSVETLKRELLGPPEYELRFNGARPAPGWKLPEGVALAGEGQSGLRFSVREPAIANPLLVRDLVQRGVEVVAIQEAPRTLEQVYLRAMEKAVQ